ncbi:MAG: transcription antitermination factor NusB [Ruminiclostridium sp.]|nr:transcription antitermination factor NusB [Ruminiclostridium sp.]
MNDKKLTRHEMREAALLILFQMQLNSGTLEEIIEDCEETFELMHTKDSIKLVNGVMEHDEELTAIISGYSPSRTVDRISVINMVIMKIAIYEMKYCDNVPDKVAINEAIEFSKEYAEKNDVGFINGVLNAYYKEKNKNA